jgi:hypothetical protein
VPGWLYYRFTAETSFYIDQAAARSGVVTAFVSIGTASPASRRSHEPGRYEVARYL